MRRKQFLVRLCRDWGHSEISRSSDSRYQPIKLVQTGLTCCRDRKLDSPRRRCSTYFPMSDTFSHPVQHRVPSFHISHNPLEPTLLPRSVNNHLICLVINQTVFRNLCLLMQLQISKILKSGDSPISECAHFRHVLAPCHAATG